MTLQAVRKRAITAAWFAAAMVLFAVLSAGETYDNWQDTYEVEPVQISSGNAEFEALVIHEFSPLVLHPGEISAVPVQLNNVGSSDLQVVASNISPTDVMVSLIDASFCGDKALLSSEPVHILAGESRDMCLQIYLNDSVSFELSGEVDIVFEGQAASWTSWQEMQLHFVRGDASL